jgi:hypothetical protein
VLYVDHWQRWSPQCLTVPMLPMVSDEGWILRDGRRTLAHDLLFKAERCTDERHDTSSQLYITESSLVSVQRVAMGELIAGGTHIMEGRDSL